MFWEDILLQYSPFLIVIMAVYVLYQLIYINKYYNKWEITSLYLIPLSIAASYIYIGLFNPTIELARTIVRILFPFCLGNSITVLSSVITTLIKRRGRK